LSIANGVHDQAPTRIAGLWGLAARLKTGINRLTRARVDRALVDQLQRFDLLGAEALQLARIEAAGAGVGDNAVLHSVERIALRDGRLADAREILAREHCTRLLQRRVRRPELAHVQVREAKHGRAGDDTVVVVGVALRRHETLAAARRAAVEIRVLRRSPVVCFDDGLRFERHLVNRTIAVVDDALAVEQPRGIRRDVARVRRRRGVAVTHGLGHRRIADDAGEAAAADGLEPAIPSGAFGQPHLEVDRWRNGTRDAAERRDVERLLHTGRPELTRRHALGYGDLGIGQRDLREIRARGRRVGRRADAKRNGRGKRRQCEQRALHVLDPPGGRRTRTPANS
jgi:hypothetical protein